MEALRNADFRWIWLARLVSLLGSWLLVVAAPAQVYALTGSVTATGLTLAADFLPPLLLGPIAGVLADRWDRRRLMIAADLLCAAAVTLLVTVDSAGEVWLVYVALLVESVGAVLFRPAAQALVPAVVGTGSALSSANALNAATDGTVRLIGGPLGGALFATAGFPLVVWLDAGSYLLSAALLLLARPVRVAGRAVRRRVVADLREGLSFVRAERTARGLFAAQSTFLFANAALTTLLVPYGVTVLGGAARVGVVMSALGVGFLIGAPLLRALIDRLRPGPLLCGALTGTAAGYALLFRAEALPTALPAAVLIGATGSVALGVAQTTLQRVTRNELLGRVSAAMFTCDAAATLAGALAGPPVAAALSIPATATLAAGVTLLSAVAAALLVSGPARPADPSAGDG